MHPHHNKCLRCQTISTAFGFFSIWASNKELLFQPTQCENARITRKRWSPERTYTLNETTLKMDTKARDLGVQVSYNLMWVDHTVNIISKANRLLGFLRKHWWKDVSCDIQKILYTSLVRSHLIHSRLVWSCTLSSWFYLPESEPLVSFFADLNSTTSAGSFNSKLLPLCYFLEYLDLFFFFPLYQRRNKPRCIKICTIFSLQDSLWILGAASLLKSCSNIDISWIIFHSYLPYVDCVTSWYTYLRSSAHQLLRPDRVNYCLTAIIPPFTRKYALWRINCPICKSPDVDTTCCCWL